MPISRSRRSAFTTWATAPSSRPPSSCRSSISPLPYGPASSPAQLGRTPTARRPTGRPHDDAAPRRTMTIPSASDLLVDLVRAPTVTPRCGPAFDVLERRLAPSGFSVDRPVFSDPGSEPVENLFAAIGEGPKHLTLAGHVDVVPPGPESRWRHPPFAADIVDGVLYGRGAVDMKAGIAAMLAAALRFAAKRGPVFGGRLSLLITGDEEGAAVNGTTKLLEWA